MLDRFRVLLDEVLGVETPKEDDNEEGKIKWIIDEFDFRNNNDELKPGEDFINRRKASALFKRNRKRAKITESQSEYSSSLYETSSDFDSS
jgi:hypothetical protein